jgi:uncharacterized hydrophobic protein (TIGR00271 family)
MRQLLIRCPANASKRVTEVAQKHDGQRMSSLVADEDGAEQRLVVLHLPNDQVEDVIAELGGIPGLQIALAPQDVLLLEPPQTEAPSHLVRVRPLSPLEIYLAGLQSVGSWGTFLGYAAAAGALAWIGLYTDTIFLLTAAMLVAPFGSPAMNLAIATARGDLELMARSLARYVVALALAVVIAGVLSRAVGQATVTSQMAAVGNVSSVALLLPLIAGAAGAISQAQSERASLVSGAAVGMLVAASIAPPAALIGMASALHEWPLAKAGFFLLLLQLVGINLAGAAVFRLFGLRAQGARYARGRRWVAAAAAGLSLVALASLIAWQFGNSTHLRQDTAALEATSIIQATVGQSPLARLVEAQVRYPRPRSGDSRTLLCQVFVQSRGEHDAETVKRQLEASLLSRLTASGVASTVLVDVTVLRGSVAPPSRERRGHR